MSLNEMDFEKKKKKNRQLVKEKRPFKVKIYKCQLSDSGHWGVSRIFLCSVSYLYNLCAHSVCIYSMSFLIVSNFDKYVQINIKTDFNKIIIFALV